jgi:membrane-associated protease RseP (regulator of RpoE activity)
VRAGAGGQESRWAWAWSDLTDAQKKELRCAAACASTRVDGAAARAGLREGDVILSLDNTEITDASSSHRGCPAEKARAISVLVRRGDGGQLPGHPPRPLNPACPPAASTDQSTAPAGLSITRKRP